MALGEEIFLMSRNFPNHEMYNLTSQIVRASDSIALNISEGSILQSQTEFGRFLRYSIRSIAEVVTCLYKAKSRHYINDEIFNKFYDECFNLMNQIIGFKNKLN